jgi:uncharacterized protein
MPRNIRKILRELKEGLVKIYGDQLEAVYLFGSFARGEGKLPDSDIDVMVVLNGKFDYWDVSRRSSEFIAALCLEHDVVISRKFASDLEYRHSGMPLFVNVRNEGLAV